MREEYSIDEQCIYHEVIKREGFIIIKLVDDAFGNFLVEFKDRKQVENIFKVSFKKLNLLDLIYWCEVHSGTEYHSSYIGPEITDYKHKIEQVSEVAGTYSFVELPVDKDFNYSAYIRDNFPEYDDMEDLE